MDIFYIKKRIVHFLYIVIWLFRKPISNDDFLGQAQLSIYSRFRGEINPMITYTAFI